MAIHVTHDLHRRRFSRNLGVGLTLVALVAIIFALTVVKIERTGEMEAFDHQPRPALARESGQ